MLKINDLTVKYEAEKGTVRAVNGVSVKVKRGENLGIIGESGCGKTTFAKTLLRLLPSTGQVAEGSVKFRGQHGDKYDLLKMSKKNFRKKIRWRELSYVPQSAMNALNPVYTAGRQIIEVIKLHSKEGYKREEAVGRVKELFELVGVDEKRFESYPHQLSGGMRQRVLIAMSLALKPSLILADEPTTALDVIVQYQILQKITELSNTLDNSMIIITHDAATIAETCEDVAVMYAGLIMEHGSSKQIFTNPIHPYSKGLIESIPNIKVSGQELNSIPGSPPSLYGEIKGCPFVKRCGRATNICESQLPPPTSVGDHYFYRCNKIDKGQVEVNNYKSDKVC